MRLKQDILKNARQSFVIHNKSIYALAKIRLGICFSVGKSVIAIPNRDRRAAKIKIKALKQGVKYQAFIAEIIHRVAQS